MLPLPRFLIRPLEKPNVPGLPRRSHLVGNTQRATRGSKLRERSANRTTSHLSNTEKDRLDTVINKFFELFIAKHL